ncbi:hypothetical protein NQ318_011250 [Aromia moschata]|uniref:Uncharacterized protein n=1 Tax=Aromia moschata TaxID=1265417 RepID=A0AAV8YIT1_9CUCU|nr:hypothetical protein NQ318_011250 [Aromia moschata]
MANDEYTRITTPRQDVLFKKGYLNKPKNYQTQTSTGTSTTSTGNSTGNGTPDHQSTDLEYESQFVFPNGFVDQNGIYYVNGYESYPLMLYNPPTYYQEFSNLKSKRYSTDSLTESMSPNNEEATSQELSGGEASNNVSDYSGHHPVYNMIYPGYYVNEVCPPHDMMNGQCQTDLTRRIKKRRRRKTSKSQSTQDSSEYTEDESDSGDEDKPKNHPISAEALRNCHITKEEITQVEEKPDTTLTKEDANLETEETEANTQNELEKETEDKAVVSIEQSNRATSVGQEEEIKEESDCVKRERSSPEVHRPTSDTVPDPESEEKSKNLPSEVAKVPAASNLKPDAEEFIPRAYRSCDTPITSNVPFLKVPPNFVSIPVLPLGEFNGQNFNPAFIPPGIPINFLPPDAKMFPNFVGFIPNFVPKSESETEGQSTSAGNVSNQTEKKETCDNSNTAKDDKVHQTKEPVVLQNVNNKTIDIATIVSKLEEAAKEQEDQDAKKSTTQHQETPNSPRKKFYENKYTKEKLLQQSTKFASEENYYSHENINDLPNDTKEIDTTASTEGPSEKKLDVHNVFSKKCDTSNGTSSATTEQVIPDVRNHQQINSPERIKKNWKQHHYQNGSQKWQQNNATKDFRYKQNGKIYSENEFKEAKAKQNYKNYSTILTTKTRLPERKNLCESYQSQRQTYESSKKETKTEASNRVVVSPAQQTNQWISVSNRKKRKNKNADENDSYSDVQFEEEKEEHSSTDLFESYDVNLLVDVVPQKDDDVIKVETTENVIIAENIVETLSQNDTNSADNNIDDSLESKADPLDLPSVEDPEQQDTVKIITEEPDNLSHEQINTPENEITGTEERELPEFTHIATQLETVDKSKKKTKKGTQKPQTKRVIITDLDLSMQKEEIKTPR